MCDGPGPGRVIWKHRQDALICAAQEQAVRTKYIKCKTNHTTDNNVHDVRWKRRNNCVLLVNVKKGHRRKEYTMRYDNVARIVYWELCNNYGLGRTETWYGQTPEMSIKITSITMLWYILIQWDSVLYRKLDILVVNKEDKYMHYGYNITCPREDRQADKEIVNSARLKCQLYRFCEKPFPLLLIL